MPVAKILSLDKDGLLKIGFDKPLLEIDAVKNILGEEIALRWLQEVDTPPEEEKKPRVRNETYLTENGYSDFEIRPALELRVESANEGRPLDFTAQLAGFSQNVISI